MGVQIPSPALNQLEHYLALAKRYPTTIVLDLTRDKNNLNVESLYSTLETIKKGRLDLTFYGRFKSAHLIVFTNNVLNLSVLVSERFNLLAITDKIHNYAIVKCDASLKIDNYSTFLVTCYSKIRVNYDKDQESFYKKSIRTWGYD